MASEKTTPASPPEASIKGTKLSRFWNKLGPGLITGASDDDPSGIATYSQAGALFGLTTLWTALLTFPLMAAVQEMCARIGMVTSAGLTGTLKKSYPRWVLYLMILFSFPAIVLNIGADIAGMGAVSQLLFPQIHAAIFNVAYTALLIVLIIYLPYKKFSAILKYLCLVLLVYLILPFLAKQDWPLLLRSTFVPEIHFTKEFIGMLVAILGTTISPYLFFWQASMEVEEMGAQSKNLVVNKTLISRMRTDVYSGMFFSNLVMYFVILSTGTFLYRNGIHQIDTVDQAAQALKPLAGEFAYLLFAIGIIGTGLIAVPVLAGSLSYIFSETFGWEEGLDKKFHEAKGFYIVIIISMLVSLGINFLGISPVQALIYTAVLYGLTAPVIIAIVLHICNNENVMGKQVNGKASNIFGFLALILMTTAGVLLIWFQFFS
jgi:NRAMP (natural resistance-associated macrophage protein)-like metal ion transporter